MSENINEQADSVQKNNSSAPNYNKVKISKIPLLLSLLALVAIGYIAYEGTLGRYGIKSRIAFDYQQNQRIKTLEAVNQQLMAQLDRLETSQTELKNQLQQLNPTQTSLIIYQLNSLIGGANQSLLLYHDYVGAIKQLGYAKQILNTTNDPLFTALKISLVKDLDQLQSQNNFDNTVLAAQLDELYQSIDQLKIVAPVKNTIDSNVKMNIWDKFIVNLKNSLLSLVRVVKTNENNPQAITHGDELALRQHLQLNILNARQGLLTHNQELWLNTIGDARLTLQNFFVTDQLSQKDLTILDQLAQVKFGTEDVNLDKSLQELNKIQQLNNGK